MKRRIPLILAGVLALGALAATQLETTEEGPEAQPTLYGNVDLREVALAFRQGGRLASVAVEEGDALAEGAVIASLDDEPFREAMEVAEARLEGARIRLRQLEKGSRPQEIERARAALEEAEARLGSAERNLERQKGLAATGASSERELEQAREMHETALARRESARAALDLAKEGFRSEEVAAGHAEVRLAEAQLEQARTALEDAVLLAPSAGTVLTRVREPGAMVGAGAPIATLQLGEPVVVRAYVPEPLLGKVTPGTAVEVLSDSSSRAYSGKVGFVSPRAEFTPKTVETPELRTDLVYRLRIVVEDADAALLDGMPVTVRLPAGTEG